MTKIILIGSEDKSYAVVKNVVSELSFRYDDDLNLLKYEKITDSLKQEILKNDSKKIYIVNTKLLNSSKDILKFIRENDWHSDIILINGQEAVLSESWEGIHNIFDVIGSKDDLDDSLKKDLNLIFKHNCYDKTFNYRNRDMNLNIYFEKILYIYRDTEERKVVVVTDNNLYTINMDLKDTFYLLDNRFRQVHRACVVNTTRTEKFDWSNNSFILDNGEEINMLSKHYKDNISDCLKF